MKNKLSLAFDILLCAALIISLFWCLSSSFDISVKWVLVIIPTVIFCAVYGLLAHLVKKTRILLACVGVTVLVFMLSLVFSFSEILSQLGYVLSQIFKEYSKYLALPESVTLGGKTSYAANGLFVFVSALLSAAFTISLIRFRKIFVLVLFSVALLVTDFVLVNTLPEIVPLFAVVGILFTLFLTRGVRKFRPSQCGAVSIGALAAVTAVMVVVLALNPVDNYVRSDWQNELLENVEKIFNIESGGERSVLDKAQSSLEKTQNLSEVSELVQTHTPELTVTSTQKSGTMYLFGTAYANYSDNTWSVLTDSQKESYEEELNTFTMTTSSGKEISTKVHMLGHSSLLYFPYFTEGFSDGSESLYDICMAGSGSDFEYTHARLNGDKYLNWTDSVYSDFVYSTYLQVPFATKSALLGAAEENGWFNELTNIDETLYGGDGYVTESIDFSDIIYYYDTNEIADAVKEVVSTSAAYSLDTPQMPDGKDFPVWFLTESSTGYCVHFATSAVLLLRSLGVPARYVTGYYFSLAGGIATVTSDNAHAWAEYYVDGTGWMPLECTPSGFTPAVYTGNTGTSLSINETQAPQSGTSAAMQPTAEQSTTVQTTTVQPTTAQSTAGGEQSDDSQSGSSGKSSGGSSNGSSAEFEWNAPTIILLVSGAFALAVTVIFLRRIIILSLRKRRMRSGTTNRRTIEAYREISRLARASHIYVPSEIEEIYERARFSNHKITEAELEQITDFYYNSVKELYSNSAWYKRLFFRFVVLL